MKNIHATIIIFSLSVIMLCTSCVHYYYAPGANNVPLFKEKNEGRIQLQYSSGNFMRGFDLQSAYAVGKHLGLQCNFLYAGENDEDYGSGNGTYIEAAMGYFKPLNNNRWVFETYAGLGTGIVHNKYEMQASATTGVTKLFIQPSFGYSSINFEMALSSEFSTVIFKVRNSTLTKDNNFGDFDDIEFLRSTKSSFFWEPGIIIRGGFKNVKALAQLTVTLTDNARLPIENTNFSLGIIVPFRIKSK